VRKSSGSEYCAIINKTVIRRKIINLAHPITMDKHRKEIKKSLLKFFSLLFLLLNKKVLTNNRRVIIILYCPSIVHVYCFFVCDTFQKDASYFRQLKIELNIVIEKNMNIDDAEWR
jgi:hypothetical protein